jgi:hypothetical protein
MVLIKKYMIMKEGKVTFLMGEREYKMYYVDLMSQDDDYKRLKYYSHGVPQFCFETKKETDTHIYWSICSKTPMFENGKLFFKHNTHDGATYDKKKQTMKIWFGKRLCNLDHSVKNDIMSQFAPWFKTEGHFNNLLVMINSRILNKIVKCKINSIEELVAEFCKNQPYKRLNIDTKLFTKVLTCGAWLPGKELRIVLEAAEDVNRMLNWILVNGELDNDLIDLSRRALAIDQKIPTNFTWEEGKILRDKYYNIFKNRLSIYEGLEVPSYQSISYNNNLPF